MILPVGGWVGGGGGGGAGCIEAAALAALTQDFGLCQCPRRSRLAAPSV